MNSVLAVNVKTKGTKHYMVDMSFHPDDIWINALQQLLTSEMVISPVWTSL